MKAKFIGDPMQPDEPLPDSIEAFGVTFPKGRFVEVPEERQAKFRGNSHFEVQEKPEPQS